MQRSKYHAPLYRIARSLPFADVSTSVLRCSFTNKLMDEDDPPCSLPNGRAVCKSLMTRLALDLYQKDLPLSAWLHVDAAMGDYDIKDTENRRLDVCQVLVA